MSVIAKYSHLVAGVIPEVGREDFSRLLADMFKRLVPIDEVSVIVYGSARMPEFDFAIPEPTAQSSIDVFLKGAFLLDPYFIAATNQEKSGFFHLRELAPTAFRQSEYYRIYYRKSGLNDECGYLVPISDGGFVNIALARTSSNGFRKSELGLLNDIAPMVQALCEIHWQPTRGNDSRGVRLRARLEAALSSFGESLLTKRECQVVNLILVGHSTKTLADALKISPETVKLHRKHAYAKLDIKSQSELFYLFIDSLMSIEGYAGGDPLRSYLDSPA